MQTINKRKFKKRFKELFFDEIHMVEIKLYFNPNGENFHSKMFYNKNNKYLGSYIQKTKKFWLSNSKIWSKLESEYTLNYMDVRDLTKGILEEHYKLKGITTIYLYEHKRTNQYNNNTIYK